MQGATILWEREYVPQKIAGVRSGEIGRCVRKIPDVNRGTSIPHFQSCKNLYFGCVPDVSLEGSKHGGPVHSALGFF